jgi:hypothetical protein
VLLKLRPFRCEPVEVRGADGGVTVARKPVPEVVPDKFNEISGLHLAILEGKARRRGIQSEFETTSSQGKRLAT